MENNFVDYVSSDLDFRISYPGAWKIHEEPTTVVFRDPAEDPSNMSTTYTMPTTIFILIRPNPQNLNAKERAELDEKEMRQSYTSLEMLDSSPTNLGGAEAYRQAYITGIGKTLQIIITKNGKSYYLVYSAPQEKHPKLLSTFEQMISSFELIDLETAPGQMPTLSLLTRPMVDVSSLPIKGYDVKNMQVVEEATGKIDTAYNQVGYFEVQPIEATYYLIFKRNRGKEVKAVLDIKHIKKVKISTIKKGLFTKIEDQIVEIKSIKDNGKHYITKLDVNDNYADEIVKVILSSKRAELDRAYWTHHSFTRTAQDGQKNTIDIFPLTPFLATGEEIIWQSLKAHIDDKNGKVFWIDALTNYRVFQYSYDEHRGAVMLFPSVEDVRITNEERGVGLGQYSTSSPYLMGIQPSGVTGIVGEVAFYSQGSPSPWITFTQVNDPITLSTVIRTLIQQQVNTHVADGETEPKVPDQPIIESVAVPDSTNQKVNLACTKCDNKDNPVGSKFCNWCGSPLSATCTKCSNSNPTSAKFCGQCGSKLGE